MRLSIIGIGNVGAGLGRAWAAKGHQVFYGVRDPDAPEVKQLMDALGENVQAGSVAEAGSFGEVITLAVPWDAALDVVKSLGDVSGKIINDCTNPLESSLEGLKIGTTTSAAEEIAKAVPGAKVVNCFNTAGAKNLKQPSFNGQAIDAYVCGDDEAAKRTMMRLAEEIGFEAVDCGSLKAARFTEALAMLWIHLCYKQQMGEDIAFKLLKR